MSYRDLDIEEKFPNIKNKYKITSPKDYYYNCIAFAAGDTKKWWWPNSYWPKGVPRSENLDAFIKCYQSLGYEVCESSNFEVGFDKVAIFVDQNNKPTHAAKQFSELEGVWKSKLGPYKDIEHSLHGLTGSYYGKVAVVLKKNNT